MSNEASEDVPLRALPLEYSRSEDESLRSILRLLAWIFIIWQSSHLGMYLFDSICYLWEQNDPSVRRKLLRWIPLAIRSPQAIVAFYMLINSPAILRLSVAGRRWIIFGAITQSILAVLVDAAMSLDMIFGRHVFSYSAAYGLQFAGQYWLLAVAGLLDNLLVAVVFRSCSV